MEQFIGFWDLTKKQQERLAADGMLNIRTFGKRQVLRKAGGRSIHDEAGGAFPLARRPEASGAARGVFAAKPGIDLSVFEQGLRRRHRRA